MKSKERSPGKMLASETPVTETGQGVTVTLLAEWCRSSEETEAQSVEVTLTSPHKRMPT